MGMNDENARRLVFDIETAPLPDAKDYIEPAEAPANYKDPVKIALAIAEKNVEALTKCGLDCDLCQIVAIGWQLEGDEPLSATLAGFNGDEALMLRAFWALASDRHLIGFNCLGFDLPVLLRRSLYLGVKTPHLQIDKYKHPQITDLKRVLDFNGALRSRSLSFYAKRFGTDSTPSELFYRCPLCGSEWSAPRLDGSCEAPKEVESLALPPATDWDAGTVHDLKASR